MLLSDNLPNKPESRIEKYLSRMAGENTPLPDMPESRVEQYLNYIARNSGAGDDSSVSVDSTLSVSGAAADAKAVGDALQELEYLPDVSESGNGTYAIKQEDNELYLEELPEVDPTLSIEGVPADAKAVGDALQELEYLPDVSESGNGTYAIKQEDNELYLEELPEVDPTLSIEGAPADAKAVGLVLSHLRSAGSTVDLTKEQIYDIVTSGNAADVFDTGDQIHSTFNDGTHEYECPWDIVAIRDVVNASGKTVPGMMLQMHYTTPGIQFDASEAIYVCPSTLAPGTYNIEIGTTWGNGNVVAGDVYSFTTTVEVPAGGQIVFSRAGNNIYIWGAPDQNPSTWVCYTFASSSSLVPLETLPIAKQNSGSALGVTASNIKYSTYGMNNLQRAAYGYNRYSQSAVRQWLNSDAPAGEWWNSQNAFDRPPQQLATMRGFKACLPNDFLSIVNPVRITTALNTLSDGDIGTTETVTDTFFLPSLEEEYAVPQLAGAEGAYFPYWKERTELNAPSNETNANRIRYLISNHSAAQYVRYRSALRGDAYDTWSVYAAGGVRGYYAPGSGALSPVCVICES